MARSRARAAGCLTGFTLVELLVVVAIIALLVSILLPALSRARDLAQSSVCASNLNGLGKAIVMYEQDFNGLLPMGVIGGGHDRRWYFDIAPYAGGSLQAQGPQGGLRSEGERNIFRCPSAKTAFKWLTWMIDPVSYVCNTGLLAEWWYAPPDDPYSRRVNPDNVETPSRSLMLVDGAIGANYLLVRSWESDENTWGVGDKPANDGSAGDRPVRYWHGGQTTCNMLMADYHVHMGVSAVDGREEHYQRVKLSQ